MNVQTPAAADFRLESFDFEYPESLIASRPAEPRDSSRLLVIDRSKDTIEHKTFRDIADYLRPGDAVVVNKSKVWPARLLGRKATGGKVDVLLVRELAPGRWACLSSDLKRDSRLEWDGGGAAQVERLNENGEWELAFSPSDVHALMAKQGLPPLPPYILKQRRTAPSDTPDLARYQTVYAKEQGSIAAPTAGLHFTDSLVAAIQAKGVRWIELTLHVGIGTFKPVTASDVREHPMRAEWYSIDPASAGELARIRAGGGRIFSVGTTATRSLETFAATGRTEGWTELYIHPGFAFKQIDALVTNFHLPRSTPLVLACAFAGKERLIAAYKEAVARGYRLYSYGDATLIL